MKKIYIHFENLYHIQLCINIKIKLSCSISNNPCIKFDTKLLNGNEVLTLSNIDEMIKKKLKAYTSYLYGKCERYGCPSFPVVTLNH